MNLSDVKSVPTLRRILPRVGRGRGSGWGKTSRRGHKGAKSRTGWGGGIMREGGQMPIVRRVPKKGFNNAGFRVNYEVVNLEKLAGIARGGEVTPAVLKEVGLVKKSARWVKVLGNGEPGAALKVSAHHFSRGAREKIEKAGGSVIVLPGRHGKLAPASLGERHAASEAIRTAKMAEEAKKAALKPKKGKDEAAAEEAGGKGEAKKAAEKKAPKKPAEKPGHEGKGHEGKAHEGKGPETKAQRKKAQEEKDSGN